MSSSIFCNPINPHTEKVDDNCVVFFQDSPYPNIIFRPTLGILKPYSIVFNAGIKILFDSSLKR